MNEIFLDIFLDLASPFDCGPLSDTAVEQAEARLNCKLPEAYIQLLKHRNGGMLQKMRFASRRADGELCNRSIIGLFGVAEGCGLLLEQNGQIFPHYLAEQWGYPEDTVAIAQMGHGGLLLDYRVRGRWLEPEIVYVDAEDFPNVVTESVASDFATFLRELR